MNKIITSFTSSGMNLVSFGGVIGPYLESVDATHTKVTVITKRRIATQIATTLTEVVFQRFFKVGAGNVKSDTKCPIDVPNVD
ncbi:MAG: hypothetical protein ACI9FN_000261 [Saprospiraceae bacterium]|jgi:hypothetical protein